LTRGPLSPAEIDAFDRQGYLLCGRLIDDAAVTTLRAACERLYREEYDLGAPPDTIAWRPGDDPRMTRQLCNAWKSDRAFQAHIFHPGLAAMAAQLMRTDTVRVFHDQALHKPGNGGRPVVWHQDYGYWQALAPPDMVSCWVALDDVTLDGGCLQFIEGSHLWGLQKPPTAFLGDDMDEALRTLDLPPGTEIRKIPIVVPAGHGTFHHCLTFHGSGVNETANVRRAIVAHYMPGHTRYRAQFRHGHDHLFEVADGEILRGRHFPVVFGVE
jgi:ectoine hydroxylase-related dioxygenase (phytanoyl-CoA dioxygenase family)